MSISPRSLFCAWPRLIPPGATIGLVSPSGPSEPEDIDRAVTELERRGYRVVRGEHVSDHAEASDYPYLAGPDDARVGDLNRFLEDSSIDMILCARGGYGAAKLLDRINYEAMRRDPKPLVGYSDITALSLAIAAKANVVSFSGIMATAGDGFAQATLDTFSEASLWHAVGDTGFPRIFRSPEESDTWTIHRPPANGGDIVTGPLYPVCLSLLASLVGTPYVPDLTGAILVIEDVDEELYAVDRMLTQLRLAGSLENLAAICIGSFNGLKEEKDYLLVHGVPKVCLALAPPSVAIVSGIAYGHIARRLTLPVGAITQVNLRNRTFTFDNAAPVR